MVSLFQFNRIVNIAITNRETGTNSLQIQISKLRVEFDIHKTETSDSNKARINIYNMSKNTRNLIDKVDSLITMYAGYSENKAGLGMLFSGDISNVSHKIEKPDIVTSIEAKDGGMNLQDKKISVSYSGNVSVKHIISDIIKNFGFNEQISFGKVEFTDLILNNGFAFIGQTKTVMDKLTSMVGLNWSIQNNELKIYKEDYTDNTIVINLSSSTGLIGSPEQIKIKTSKTTTSNKQIDGWKIVSLLTPKAEPGGKVILSSRQLKKDGEFKILKVDHVGDTHGGQWTSVMQAVEI